MGVEKRLYGRAFYEGQQDLSLQSARIVVPIVVEDARPKSVVDYGCGVGTWLLAFQENGVQEFLGIDGAHVQGSMLRIPSTRFLAMDLREARPVGQFDLAVCLEVAEHLPQASAERLVGALVESAPAVLFGAAVPGQGGTGHINERWQGEWAEMFAAHGYFPSDVLRQLWAHPQVEYYYVQNTLLYSPSGDPYMQPLSVAHPNLVRRIARSRPMGIGELLKAIPDGFRASLAYRRNAR